MPGHVRLESLSENDSAATSPPSESWQFWLRPIGIGVGLIVVLSWLRSGGRQSAPSPGTLPSVAELDTLVTFGDSFSSTYDWPDHKPAFSAGSWEPDRPASISSGVVAVEWLARTLKAKPLRLYKWALRNM